MDATVRTLRKSEDSLKVDHNLVYGNTQVGPIPYAGVAHPQGKARIEMVKEIQRHCAKVIEELPVEEQERVRTASASYWSLALSGEVRELCNLVKKEVRDRVSLKEQISEEMADILIYLCMMANGLGVDLEKEYYRKQEKNIQRFEKG